MVDPLAGMRYPRVYGEYMVDGIIIDVDVWLNRLRRNPDGVPSSLLNVLCEAQSIPLWEQMEARP